MYSISPWPALRNSPDNAYTLAKSVDAVTSIELGPYGLLACYTNDQRITTSHVRAELNRFKDLDANTIILPDSCSTLLQGEGLEDFSYRVRGNVIHSVRNCMNGNITQAAQRLKVNRSSLHEIIRRLSTRNQKSAATDNLLIFEREDDHSCTQATSDR